MVRAALIGLLMPASEDPKKDREIFLKILTMDDEGLLRRKKDNIRYKDAFELLSDEERERYFDLEAVEGGKAVHHCIDADSRDEKREIKKEVQRLAFERLSYDEKLGYVYRPEEIEGPSEKAWDDIDAHLGTEASSLSKLVQQLGERRFGHVPRVGDAFSGGGSVPFEAARLGFDAYGADLNPVASLLTWASLNIVGGGEETAERVRRAQERVYEAVDEQITEWGIEHRTEGPPPGSEVKDPDTGELLGQQVGHWRADAYLYCVEATCPECGTEVPLAPSWVIGKGTNTVAHLAPNEEAGRVKIEIEQDASKEALKKADEAGTVQSDRLHCPACGQSTPMRMIRGDRRGENGDARYGLRRWENEDVTPRPGDTFGERLYCVRWVQTYEREDANGNLRTDTLRHYCTVTEADHEREARAKRLLEERFDEWQALGYIPSRRIEPGDKTDEPIRTRGWTHWHHLFNPRQLLTLGLFQAKTDEVCEDRASMVGALLGLGRFSNYHLLLSMWHSHHANEKVDRVFVNQALNTYNSYGERTVLSSRGSFVMDLASFESAVAEAEASDARAVTESCEIWLTDPPYADAVNYHELSEFFLAWYEKPLQCLFPEWYTDSKRALAIQGEGADFRQAMVESYRNPAAHMPDDGVQVVMFTHQDSSVWADLALILWAAGLRVTAAWTISTETESALKKGDYVQGTVLLVLRKRTTDATAFADEINVLVEDEVKDQLDAMQALDADEEEPSFGDTDYQLAAYAAALRVLTQYATIEDWDIERELMRQRSGGEASPIEGIIDAAVKVACDHLIPERFDRFHWKTLTPPERLYLKGLELESHGELRTGAYQELARGFGVKEYTYLIANPRANATRFKTATEFDARHLSASADGDGFASSLVRHALFATRVARKEENAHAGRTWLKNEVATYWSDRKKLVAILRYLAAMPNASEHWGEDGGYARLVAGAVENDHA